MKGGICPLNRNNASVTRTKPNPKNMAWKVFCWIIQFLNENGSNIIRPNSIVIPRPFNPDFIQFWAEHHALQFFMADYFGTLNHLILKEEHVPFLSFERHSVAENLPTLISAFFIPVLWKGHVLQFHAAVTFCVSRILYQELWNNIL